MDISNSLTDSAVLRELGERLAALRLEKNLKQEDVAREAGIGLRTLQRLESGAAASRLSSMVRVLRVMGIVGNLEALVPAPTIRPMALLRREKRRPKRASQPRIARDKYDTWSWGEHGE
jgi:transcriptional regulator with XRE-family HTH domain